MSTRPGTHVKKKPAQKHKNSTSFKFDKHRTDPTAKVLKNLEVINCCPKCTSVLEWKLKYGKYKPLTVPGKCVDCLQKTVAQNGVASLYNGIMPSTVGIVVYRGVQFGLQDIIKAFNPYQYDVSMIGIVSKFIVAQIAVSVSGIAAYPFDTMQRRLQIEASKPKSEQIYNGMGDCFAKILKNEGAGGFFKGAFANILRGTGAAITLVLYDEFMNFVNGAPKK